VDRFFIPRLGLLIVAGLATLLIGVVVLRNPDTHGNLWNQIKPGYTRTAVATLDGEIVPEISLSRVLLQVPLAQVELSGGNGASPLDPGRGVFLGLECATCHGIDARGGPVGPSLAGADPHILKNVVRNGPGGMPAYPETTLRDEDLEELAAYVSGLETNRPGTQEFDSAIRQLSYDPSVPRGVLLKGKTAMRKYCGACHTPPSESEIRGGFDMGGLLTEMTREPTLSLEEAKALGLYMLAIRNDVQLLKMP